MKKAMTVLGLAVAVTMAGIPSVALADGTSDPYKARADCVKRGADKSREKMQECCSNLILVASSKEQAKLEAQCVKGQGEKAPSKKDSK